MAMLETRELSKDYQVGQETIHALRGVDFQAHAGEFVVINGPSGSGKSTLLNLIACIDRPTSGVVYIDSQQTNELGDYELTELRKRTIGLLFQTFNLIPVLNVYENVEYPLLLLGTERSERRDRVMSLLEQVGIDDLAKRRPDEISGGQRQRVAIARALVAEPKLVLADEPTASLDSRTGHQVMDIMTRTKTEHQAAFVVVTHDPMVSQFAERVVHIRDGQFIEGEGQDHEPAAAHPAS
ncbi:MAG: ABC transporter ATP-binding protein [Candidatus Bipolaricaulia bacterium]